MEHVIDNYKYYTMDTTKKDYRMNIIEFSNTGKLIKMVSLCCDYLEYYKGDLCLYFNKYLDYKRSLDTNKIKITILLDNKPEYLYTNNLISEHTKRGIYGECYISPIRKTLKFMYKKK